MKKKDKRILAERIIQEFPGFTIKGALIYQITEQEILRGFYIEDSSFSSSTFFINYFLQPIYIPEQDIYFNFGDRLLHGNSDIWMGQEENVFDEVVNSIKLTAIPFLQAVSTPCEFVTWAKANRMLTNPHTRRAIGYSLIMEHQYADAKQELQEALTLLDRKVAWQKELGEQMEYVISLLETGNTEKIDDQMKKWTIETKTNIGV